MYNQCRKVKTLIIQPLFLLQTNRFHRIKMSILKKNVDVSIKHFTNGYYSGNVVTKTTYKEERKLEQGL